MAVDKSIMEKVTLLSAEKALKSVSEPVSHVLPLEMFRKHEEMKSLLKYNNQIENPVFVSLKSDFLYKIQRLLKQDRPIMIAITGESASGKSCFTQNLKQFILDMGIECSFISCDNFYQDISCYYEKYGNYGNALAAGVDLEGPSAFDLDELERALDDIAHGKDICIPKMNLSNGVCIKNQTPVKSAKVVLVEGIASMWNDLDKKFDVTIYVDLDEETRLNRHVERAASRDKTKEEALQMWKYMSASAQLHIQPHKEKCDVVLNGNYYKEDLVSMFSKMQKLFS